MFKPRKPSPAQIMLARKLAAATIQAAPVAIIAAERPEEGPAAAAYALLREQLGEHLRQLSSIASTELKVQAKFEMLETYADHIDTVILTADEEGRAVQDEVFVRLMIWHFDCAAVDHDLYPRAFEMAEHVLRFGLALPDAFTRSPAALIAELVAEAALAAITKAPADEPAPFNMSLLHRVAILTEGLDMVDIVRAKHHKAKGLLFQRLAKAVDAGTTEGPAGGARAARAEALLNFKRALELDKKIGVKQNIIDLERLQAKTPAEAPEPATSST